MPYRLTMGVLIPLFVIIAGASLLRAQTWQQVFGPEDGDIEGIASDAAGRIYGGSDSGIVVSANGTTWQLMNQGLTEKEVFAFSITQTNEVFAITEGQGIFRSFDFGASWAPWNVGLFDSAFVVKMISDRAGHLFVTSSLNGVFYSEDDAVSWQQRKNGLTSLNCWSLTKDKAGNIFVGATGSIGRSTDLGMSWTTLKTRAPQEQVMSLATDSSGTLYAGTSIGTVYRSTNDGAAWDSIYSTKVAIESMIANESTVFAATYGHGILVSSDRGATWNSTYTGYPDSSFFSLTITPDNYLYAGSLKSGILRTLLKEDRVENPEQGVPTRTELLSDPIGENAVIRITMNETSQVDVKLYDVTGREVRAIYKGEMNSGEKDVDITTSGLTAGIYFLCVRTGDRTQILKLPR